MLYNHGNIYLTTNGKHFVFIELSFLNSNPNNLLESSSIKKFLVDSSVNFLVDLVMYLCTRFIALLIL